MTPENTRVLRREQRHAWRGMKKGRHARPARTTFGRGQRLQQRIAEFSAFCATGREQQEGEAA